jgi:hypothetical protein
MAGDVRPVIVTDITVLCAGAVGVVESIAWLLERGEELLSLNPPLGSSTTEGQIMLRPARYLTDRQAEVCASLLRALCAAKLAPPRCERITYSWDWRRSRSQARPIGVPSPIANAAFTRAK